MAILEIKKVIPTIQSKIEAINEGYFYNMYRRLSQTRYPKDDFKADKCFERLVDKQLKRRRKYSRYLLRTLFGYESSQLLDLESEIEESCGQYCLDYNHLMINYVPTISAIKNLVGNLKDISILEIGPGPAGIKVLNYLTDKYGAITYGIDCDNELEYEKRDNIRFGRWEELSKYFDDNSIDVIYVNYMRPRPYVGGELYPKEDYNLPIDKVIMNKFEMQIAEEMYKVLRHGGLFVISKTSKDSAEYQVHNVNIFKKEGFDRLMLRSNEFIDAPINIFQKSN